MNTEVKQLIEKVELILDNHQHDKSSLVAILQDIQAEYNYLPRDALVAINQGLDIPLSLVYSVATFFRSFSLKPRGRHLINVCLGTACHVRGAVRVSERIKRELGVNSGETTEDFKFTLETVNCVGACALGPTVIIDGQFYGQMRTNKVDSLLENYD